jgi:hypothetical protein
MIANPSRGRVVRDALLAWLYEHRSDVGARHLSEFLGHERAVHQGRPFSDDEIGAAAAVLRDQGLVAASGVEELRWPLNAIIEPAGIAYIEDGPPSPAETNVINFHGDVDSSQVQQASPSAQQESGLPSDPEAAR